ncbi:hypothetical protein [Thermococcus peptonophilus]
MQYSGGYIVEKREEIEITEGEFEISIDMPPQVKARPGTPPLR